MKPNEIFNNLRNNKKSKKNKVALVLSGGGARGIAHVGVIEELKEQGFEISSVAGTSMGALVGAMYALGKLDDFKEWIVSLDLKKTFNLVDFTFSKQGLVKGDKVMNKMQEFIADTKIDDLSIPYAAVATDITNKKEVVFTSGSLYDAIRASISIPSVFTPVRKDDRILVDGGVLNNIPVNHITRTKKDILIVVNANADAPVIDLQQENKKQPEAKNLYQKKVKEVKQYIEKLKSDEKDDKMSYFDLISTTIDMMRNKMAELLLINYDIDLLIKISKNTSNIFDFHKAEKLIETGRIAARNAIENAQNNDE